MVEKNCKLLTLIFLVGAFQACTIQKRTVNKGYFIQWNRDLKTHSTGQNESRKSAENQKTQEEEENLAQAQPSADSLAFVSEAVPDEVEDHYSLPGIRDLIAELHTPVEQLKTIGSIPEIILKEHREQTKPIGKDRKKKEGSSVKSLLRATLIVTIMSLLCFVAGILMLISDDGASYMPLLGGFLLLAMGSILAFIALILLFVSLFAYLAYRSGGKKPKRPL